MKGDETVHWMRYASGLVKVAPRICMIEFDGEGVGTGFLVGPDVVLTNYHVIEPILKKDVSASAVQVRFDHSVQADGKSTSAGVTYGLAEKWDLAKSPYSAQDVSPEPTGDPAKEELDFAFIRIASRPGEEKVTVDLPPFPATQFVRGWITYAEPPHDFKKRPRLTILQHPRGEPLQMGTGKELDAFLTANRNETRIRYTTITAGGSSGSPIFNLDWRCVGLHHAGDPLYEKLGLARYNQGIPIVRIREWLAKYHQEHLLQRMALLEPGVGERIGLTDAQRLDLQADISRVYVEGATAGARLAGVLASHGLNLADYRTPTARPEDVAMALISIAEKGGWVEQLGQVVKDELALLSQTSAFTPPPPQAGIASGAANAIPPVDRVLLRGVHMLIGRRDLRPKLRELLADDNDPGPKILVVRDVAATPAGRATGKSHTLQLISTLGVRAVAVDLLDLPPAATPRQLADLIVERLGFPTVLAAVDQAAATQAGAGAGDEQWPRWNMRFCQALKNAMDAQGIAQPDAPSTWLVLDSFNQVALSAHTQGLVKALAAKLDKGWSRLRLVLLGYTGRAADLPAAIATEEEVTGTVTAADLMLFFRDAYRQKGVAVTPPQIGGAVRRLLAALALDNPDFLKLAPALILHELSQAPSE